MKYRYIPLFLAGCLALAACGKKAPQAAADQPSQSGTATAASSSVNTPAPAKAQVQEQAPPFDPASVPVSTHALPPFPYLDWPDKLHEAFRSYVKKEGFDAAYVVTGNTLRRVEGRVEVRRFALRDAQLSQLAVMRNYDNAIKALGGVQIPGENPSTDAFIAAHGGNAYDLKEKKLLIPDITFEYAAYLLRTPDRNIWFGISSTDSYATVATFEEQAMTQSVSFVKAEAMKSELDQKGRVALYINFDSDRATVRADGKPAVDEIVKLMRDSPTLKIAVEGHTDNSGNAAHNKTLSEERAAAVVAALVAAGIDKGRMQSAGFGAERPLADNATDEGRARNRRVELVKR